jgi:hypothetical protein
MEYIVVVDTDDDGDGADIDVYSESGTRYEVHVGERTCTCPDFEKREPAGGCKHIRRVDFERSERDIPEWADRDAIDPDLLKARESARVDAQATTVIADGGHTDDDARRVCDDCAHLSGLACFECYRRGFETPRGAVAPADAGAGANGGSDVEVKG